MTCSGSGGHSGLWFNAHVLGGCLDSLTSEVFPTQDDPLVLEKQQLVNSGLGTLILVIMSLKFSLPQQIMLHSLGFLHLIPQQQQQQHGWQRLQGSCAFKTALPVMEET